MVTLAGGANEGLLLQNNQLWDYEVCDDDEYDDDYDDNCGDVDDQDEEDNNYYIDVNSP